VETAPKPLLHPILAIYVRLELTNFELLYRFKNAIEFHINHPSQCIQKIYDLKRLSFAKEEFSGLLLNCELYRFTLEDLFKLVREKRIGGLPKAFVVFVRAFLLQAYLNLLDLLAHPQSASLCLAISLRPANILVDQFYRLMLGNPFFVESPPSPLLAFENDRKERFFRSSILKEFLLLFQRTMELCEVTPADLAGAHP
jgi:hypothetical protein